MDFVFLHIAVPHYPFVFDRHTGRDDPSNGHSYQDGLALADRQLGQIMAEVEKSPRWQNTTVILDGDHSWRTNLWVSEAGWTAEDAATAGDKFDDRPVLLVHAPGQSAPQTVDAPTPLLHVHDIVQSVVKTGKPALP
jgi:membrane-anchored protein YejM (alkaline phosphatase superfamily)